MACFLVSAAEAAVVTLVEKAEEKRELHTEQEMTETKSVSIPLSRKLNWLKWLLIGGAVLLMFEHVWHGEVVPWFPFLTAMGSQEDTAAMLSEMATTGVAMAVVVTAVWAVMCAAADAIVRRPASDAAASHTA
ncbi:MAG: hypothetical protein Q4G47_04625 [Lachnospiraceae bacterium]|nr:hypothetical protein [Lachnospiraceae bacterium]